MADKLQKLKSEIMAIKKELMALGDLRPGSLTEQYNVCGNPACHCKTDPARRHGPYWQLSYTRKGTSKTEYIRKNHVAAVKEQIQNYARLQSLIDRWVDISIEISQIKMGNKT